MKNYYFLLTFVTFICLNSCSEDNTNSSNTKETITTLELQYSSTLCGATVAFARDLNSVSGKKPSIDTIRMFKDCFYDVRLKFSNESNQTSIDLTNELNTKGTEHLVCFTLSGISNTNLQISRSDIDANSIAIGLKSIWEVVNKGKGTINIQLKHQPNGTKNGSCNVGETDVQVNFPIIID